MTSQHAVVDASTAQDYIGQTVLVELHWDDEPESYWYCLHLVLPAYSRRDAAR